VLDGLRHEGCAGALVWCHTDYASAIWDQPPLDEATHERSFGLWRADGSAKPALAGISAFAGRPRLRPPVDDWIDVDEETYRQDPAAALVHLYDRYRERATALRG
jgi:hypothetical protein